MNDDHDARRNSEPPCDDMDEYHDNGHNGDLCWDDPRLHPGREDPRTARYRLLQSWYREVVLGRPRHGKSQKPPRRCVGNMLHEDDVKNTPGLNLMPEAVDYSLQRVQEVNAAGGAAEGYRFQHNMLSSMPMCFSLFGMLRGLPDKGLGIVRELFDEDAEEVESIECEWKPQSNPLGDNTAFDAAILTRRSDGTRHLIGVETKYTEPFSPTEYLTSRYVEVHNASRWFRAHSIVRCASSGSNQLWRSLLLAAAYENAGEVDRASVVVLALAGDPGAEMALKGLSMAWADDNQARCRFVSWELLVGAACSDEVRGTLPPNWAQRFNTRYLDLTPVAGDASENSPVPTG